MCQNLPELMKAQKQILLSSIDYHAWCNQIIDKNDAFVDFINKYGWIMRAMFCNTNCPLRENCDAKLNADK